MAELERRKSEIAAKEEASKAEINQELDDIQAMIEADEQIASRLQSKEQEQFTIKEKSRMLVEMIAERKRFFAAQRAAEQRSKPPTKAQMRNRMYTYLKNQADFEVVKDSIKNDDSSSKEAGRKEQIVQDEDTAINYETLVVKSPIVDCESQLLGSDLQEEDLSYWKITRADESSRFYKEWSVISWKLYEYCGVHTLLMDGTLVCINMLVEKKYPLTKEMLTRMLNSRLEADLESTMAFELIRFIKAQLEE
nr:hypothetical protein [Tanacetum cinerariifolium]